MICGNVSQCPSCLLALAWFGALIRCLRCVTRAPINQAKNGATGPITGLPEGRGGFPQGSPGWGASLSVYHSHGVKFGFWRVENLRFTGVLKLAPEVGLEPTTHRLTADCSTIELLWNALAGAEPSETVSDPSKGFSSNPRFRPVPPSPLLPKTGTAEPRNGEA
jgi:hypothetical protein